VPVDGVDPWAAVAATQPQHEAPGAAVVAEKPAADTSEDKLDAILGRIKSLSNQAKTPAAAPAVTTLVTDEFLPFEPCNVPGCTTQRRRSRSLDPQVSALLRQRHRPRYCRPAQTGLQAVEELLRQMKNEQLVVYRGAAQMNDYQYQVTDMGARAGPSTDRTLQLFRFSAGIAQRLYRQRRRTVAHEAEIPSIEDLQRAFSDILLNKRMLMRLGAGDQFGTRAVSVRLGGQRQDQHRRTSHQGLWADDLGAACHWRRWRDYSHLRSHQPRRSAVGQAAGLVGTSEIDQRWVRIRRPTIVVGGELTMSHLEVTINTSTGISEAPLQLKSNCGTLVIDDFGRQKMRIDELLNRWIVPLEKRYDFLNLPNGKKIQVPFDQLIIFSTNLQPKDLVDEAFLRRIPYKIDVTDPSEEEFRELFRIMASKLGFEYRDATIDHLIQKQLSAATTPFPLLPAARLADADSQFLSVSESGGGNERREFRLCRRELLRGDVSLRRANVPGRNRA